MDASDDLVIGLVILSALAAVPLFVVGIAALLMMVAVILLVFFCWGGLVNVGVRSLLAVFFKDNGHWWGFIEGGDLLGLVLLASGLVIVPPAAIVINSYYFLSWEDWLTVLHWTGGVGAVGMPVSLVGYFVTSRRFELPYLSEIALRAEEIKLETKLRIRLLVWGRSWRLRWLELTGG